MEKFFEGKKVVIMGLGLHGGGSSCAKFFCGQGADVIVTDLKSEKQLQKSLEKLKGLDIKYSLSGHKEEDFKKADLIVKNPDVPNDSPFLEIARKNNIPIKTDVGIFFDLADSAIIGVTGTKGKSTVSALIYNLLKARFPDAVLAGNIGVSPLEILPEIGSGSKVVLELSSFELEGLEKSPHVAVITNIVPDHLNRYKSMSEYIDTKKIIFKYQKPEDVLILNYDDAVLRKISKDANSQVYFFSNKLTPETAEVELVSYVKNSEIFMNEENRPVIKTGELHIFGEHNVSNVLAAVTAAAIFKIPRKNIEKVLKSFFGAPHRQEFVLEKKGVEYFNDTAATMPFAAIVALKTFSTRFPKANIVLIAGGQDKNLEYEDFARVISDKIKNLVLLPGTASEKIKKYLAKNVKICAVGSMEKAVNAACRLSHEGDKVLLSPGAASFNLFKNEYDRGDQFKKFVKKLK